MVEDMDFPKLLKKELVEIPGVNWSWFLILEVPRCVTQFCRISRGERMFSLEFLRVK